MTRGSKHHIRTPKLITVENCVNNGSRIIQCLAKIWRLWTKQRCAVQNLQANFQTVWNSRRVCMGKMVKRVLQRDNVRAHIDRRLGIIRTTDKCRQTIEQRVWNIKQTEENIQKQRIYKGVVGGVTENYYTRCIHQFRLHIYNNDETGIELHIGQSYIFHVRYVTIIATGRYFSKYAYTSIIHNDREIETNTIFAVAGR